MNMFRRVAKVGSWVKGGIHVFIYLLNSSQVLLIVKTKGKLTKLSSEDGTAPASSIFSTGTVRTGTAPYYGPSVP